MPSPEAPRGGVPRRVYRDHDAGEPGPGEWLTGRRRCLRVRDEGLLQALLRRPRSTGTSWSTLARRRRESSRTWPHFRAIGDELGPIDKPEGDVLDYGIELMEWNARLVGGARSAGSGRRRATTSTSSTARGGKAGVAARERQAISEQSGWWPTAATGPSARSSASRSAAPSRPARAGCPRAARPRARAIGSAVWRARSSGLVSDERRRRRVARQPARQRAAPARGPRRSARAGRRDRLARPSRGE